MVDIKDLAEMKITKNQTIATISVVIVVSIFVYIQFILFPPLGWIENDALTTQFIDEEFGGVIPPCGYDWVVCSGGSNSMVSGLSIRLYKVPMSGFGWLPIFEREGIYLEGEFIWSWFR